MAVRIYNTLGLILSSQTGPFGLGRNRLEVPERVYRVGDTVTVTVTGRFGGNNFRNNVEVTFAGYESGTLYPIFHYEEWPQLGLTFRNGAFIGTNEERQTGSYTPGTIITDKPLGVGVFTFADYGLRVGTSDVLNSQNREIEFDEDVYEVGNIVELRIIRVSDGVAAVEDTINATFAGYDRETGDPLFSNAKRQNGDDFNNGRQIIAASVEQTRYTIPVADIVAEAWPVEATFANYGFRQGENLEDSDFDLQGTGLASGLDVPEGVHDVGDTLTIRPFRGVAGGAPVEVTLVGHVAGPGGQAYPIFEAADFGGKGRAQFIGTNEPGATATYAANNIITTEPVGIGVATFADYGLRRPGGSDVFNSQNLGIEFDQGVHRVGATVELRIIERDGVSTINATFAGYDRDTYYPLFSNPRQQNGNDFRDGRQIIAASVKQATYTVPVDEIIAKAWPPGADASTFANYGFRQGDDLDGDFNLQGTGTGSGLDVPEGVHDVGDILTIQPYGGVGGGGSVEVTLVGHVTGPGGRAYPIFEAANFGGNGRAQFIGTNEPDATATYAANNIITTEPVGIGVATFADHGRRAGTTDVLNSQGKEIEFDWGFYRVGNPVELRIISGRDANGDPIFEGDPIQATFAGFDPRTGDPVFNPPGSFRGSRQIIAASVKQTTYTAPVDEIIAEAWPPVPVNATFTNYGFRQGDFEADFNLQGTGPASGLDVPDGIHDVGDTLTIRPFGGVAGGAPVEVTLVGHVAGPGGQAYPIFEVADFDSDGDGIGDGRAQFIGTNEPDGTATYKPGTIIDDMPYATGVATFADHGLRVGETDVFDSGDGEIEFDQGVHGVGATVELRIISGRDADGDPIFEGDPIQATFAGYHRDTYYPLFNPVGGGRQIIAASVKETTYTVPVDEIIARTWPPGTDETTFANYGFRQGGDLDGDFNLQGTGTGSGLDIPDGVYRAGQTLTIQPYGGAGGGGSVTVTFRGYVVSSDGTDYPIFEAANFGGDGRAQFIGTNEPNETATYTPGALVTDMPYATGVATFADYGLRVGETDVFNSQNREIEFDQDVYEVDAIVELRIITYRGTGDERVREVETVNAEFAGFDGETGNPLFSNPRQQNGDDFADGRQIIAASEKAMTYDVPATNIVAEAWPPATTFANYGFRQEADLDGDFTLQGTGPLSGLNVEDGVHGVGDTLTIQPYGGVAAGPALTVTFRGHVVSSDGTNYPIFEAADFDGKGPARFIGTDETGTGNYTPGQLVTNTPYELGDVTFSNSGIGQNQDGTGDYTLTGNAITIPHGLYRVGDEVVFTIGPETMTGEFVGFENLTGNAIFWFPQESESLILTNQPGTGSHTVPAGGVITNVAYETDETYGTGGLTFHVFDNHGTRQGDPDGPFALQEQSVAIALGVYGVNDKVTIHISGRAISTTYIGYDTGDNGQFDPVFRPVFRDDAGLHYIGTNEPGPGNHTPGTIITDTPLEIGVVRFENVAVRVGDTGGFDFLGQSADIRAGEYTLGDTIDLTISGEVLKPAFIGYEDGTFYPVFRDDSGDDSFDFILTDEDGTAGTYELTGTLVAATYTTCFAPGTLIATPAGERAVETLRPGDEVRTADGGVATVRFVGMQRVSMMFGPRELTHPVRILAGALGRNTPHTDLVVTKDHGMILDGVICNAGALINGTSIIEVPTRELDTDPYGMVTWYHVETENHAALLANGAVAESFIDHVDRAVFSNYSEFVGMYGAEVSAMTEMNMPRAMSTRQLPNRIKWRLIERAETIQAPALRSA